MSTRVFDQKFGAEFIGSVPKAPGIYRYWAEDGGLLYVGKAKNLRRRLAGYRNATRKKVHRKMRMLVRLAVRLDFEQLESEEEALLREGELIRNLRPPHNVEGAYSFLYPSLAVGVWDKHLLLCRTTQPEAYRDLDLSWYGCFRSRLRALGAFDALVKLLGMVGHQEKATRLPPTPRLRGSRLVGFRQVPREISESLPWFLAGEDRAFPGELARELLLRPRARRDAAEVEEHLKVLMLFFEQDAVRLRQALRALGKPGSFVHQAERDALFVRAGFARCEGGD